MYERNQFSVGPDAGFLVDQLHSLFLQGLQVSLNVINGKTNVVQSSSGVFLQEIGDGAVGRGRE